MSRAAAALRAQAEVPTLEIERPLLDAALTAARQAISSEVFARAYAAGQGMPIGATIDLALEVDRRKLIVDGCLL